MPGRGKKRFLVGCNIQLPIGPHLLLIRNSEKSAIPLELLIPDRNFKMKNTSVDKDYLA
jgi:hypothetical protein